MGELSRQRSLGSFATTSILKSPWLDGNAGARAWITDYPNSDAQQRCGDSLLDLYGASPSKSRVHAVSSLPSQSLISIIPVRAIRQGVTVEKELKKSSCSPVNII